MTMEFLRPATWAEALAAKADQPDAVPIQGGTDVMVEINFAARRPPALLDLTRIDALRVWSREEDGTLRVGAGVTYTRLIEELGDLLPGLAQASRTVGSPQIRNRGTVGGNLGAASPAGDGHPPLLAGDAVIEVESAVGGVRLIPATEFYLGVKRSALQPDELIRAFRIRPAAGPQYFSKVGTRNAMVIAVCSFAVALHPGERRVGTGLGSAAPTPRRALAAEEFLAAELDWSAALDPALARRFGELVAQAAAPIDDVRGTAGYRRHALSVLGRRTLTWAWHDYRKETEACA
jgi:CO/xanthine dehydrogenase FAD-binding subunit